MKLTVELNPYGYVKVSADPYLVECWAKAWPCADVPAGRSFWALFDPRGGIVDFAERGAPRNGEAASALIDAVRTAANAALRSLAEDNPAIAAAVPEGALR